MGFKEVTTSDESPGTVGAKCIYHSIKEVDEQFGRKMGMGIGR